MQRLRRVLQEYQRGFECAARRLSAAGEGHAESTHERQSLLRFEYKQFIAQCRGLSVQEEVEGIQDLV